jgi:GDP-mannose 6-dehydrogenase
MGKNKSYIEEKLPHISFMLCESITEITEWAEVIVISNSDNSYGGIKTGHQQTIIDLVRMDLLMNKSNYQGICW